jgi:hypothetical protein
MARPPRGARRTRRRFGGHGEGWHQVCYSRAVDSKNVLMKDTMAGAIALIVKKTDTATRWSNMTPVAGEAAFPRPRSAISTFG